MTSCTFQIFDWYRFSFILWILAERSCSQCHFPIYCLDYSIYHMEAWISFHISSIIGFCALEKRISYSQTHFIFFQPVDKLFTFGLLLTQHQFLESSMAWFTASYAYWAKVKWFLLCTAPFPCVTSIIWSWETWSAKYVIPRLGIAPVQDWYRIIWPMYSKKLKSTALQSLLLFHSPLQSRLFSRFASLLRICYQAM